MSGDAFVLAVADFLCDESSVGRWNPHHETNVRPLAAMTALTLTRLFEPFEHEGTEWSSGNPVATRETCYRLRDAGRTPEVSP